MSEISCRILAVDDEPEVRVSYQHALNGRERSILSEIDNAFAEEDQEEEEESELSATEKPDQYQFNLTVADQGEMAIELVTVALNEGAPYRVAFLDMRMPPGIDGLETAKALRALDDRIYIVFVTAYSDRPAGDLDAAMEHDILLLRKPFVSEEIFQLARSLSRSWQNDRDLELALEQTRQANRAKDQFLAAMSHEFRTPLSSMLGNSELLSESGLTPPQQQLINTIDASGKQLLHRINDVLDATKIESGRLDIHPTPFQLEQLLNELKQIYTPLAQQSDLTLHLDYQLPSGGHRVGDPDRLTQILSNLLGNAIKFSSEGSVSIRVTERPSGEIRFMVEDHGIGMSEQMLSSAFHPFEQGDQSLSRSYGGIGMGLHISLQLAEKMGGTLTAESQEGQGSRFQLTLPLSRQNSPTPVVPSPPPEQFEGKILIVEDTTVMQRLIQSLLNRWGLESAIAANGQEGVEYALGGNFDLILMDMQMPVMGGIEATRLLRQVGYTAPIIALTANLTDQHRQQFFAAGGDEFQTKPINRNQLKQALHKYLQQTQKEPAEIQQPEEPLLSQELIQLFKQRAITFRTELIEAHQQGQLQQVHSAAHTLKGTGATFGYPELTRLGQAVCDAIDAGDEAQTAEQVPQLIAEMERVIAD
ncbi:MAG: response regulator [Gammaproteobacteria bacterium]|jgi:signal transduction histidine kinase/HPt (histidine-containing phosphotransfer) domain-containing protein|nr:response regulator [Gammaproteobacteria bacterium]MBT7307795.1 response regulator [Gammaproteobacteria bacterium]